MNESSDDIMTYEEKCESRKNLVETYTYREKNIEIRYDDTGKISTLYQETKPGVWVSDETCPNRYEVFKYGEYIRDEIRGETKQEE